MTDRTTTQWTTEKLLPYVSHVVEHTDFKLPNVTRYEGKVRDSYAGKDRRILIATDRLSCFDKVVTSVPFKGQVLTQLALHWFDATKDIIENHILEVLSPETLLVREARVVPIEVVVRGYLTGSAWRDYQSGKSVSGITWPSGMRQNERFEKPLITPSTKAAMGDHDEPISEEEIIARELVPATLWAEIKEKAFALFAKASDAVAARGLILVDTKFEFGVHEGKLLLVDEIFTLDSSRYWEAESLRSEMTGTPKMLDKEPIRQWLISQGWQGEGEIPEFSDTHRAELALHYIGSYEKITGAGFRADATPAMTRIAAAVNKLF